MYQVFLLDKTISGETMALNVINKINNKEIVSLIPALKCLLCNALIQPHFDYACSAWYQNLKKKLKHRVQITRNKCMRFCLHLDKLKLISHKEFERLNWLLETYRFKHCVNSIVFKYFKKQCPDYMNEDFGVTTETNFQLQSWS